MKVRLCAFGLVVSSAIGGAMVLPSNAWSQGACEPFTVDSDMTRRSVDYVDHGEEGHGPGDRRIGRMPLIDRDGNTVGRHRWQTTVLDLIDGDPTIVSESLVFEALAFEHGTIFLLSLPVSERPASETGRQSVKDFTGAVIGGTGPYAFARGTVERTFDGDRATFALNIRCD